MGCRCCRVGLPRALPTGKDDCFDAEAALVDDPKIPAQAVSCSQNPERHTEEVFAHGCADDLKVSAQPPGSEGFGAPVGSVVAHGCGAEGLKVSARSPSWQGVEALAGEVFVHGCGDCDQLGLGDLRRERQKPTLVTGLKGVCIASIACGGLHTVCASVEGSLYTWGCGDDGALGRASGDSDCEPQRLALPPEAQAAGIAMVACGDSHSCVLDGAGGVWLCGSYKDSSGYIGIARPGGLVVEKSFEPALVQGLGRIVGLASGANHTLVLESGGRRAFSWGSNQAGQLGLGNLERRCGVIEEGNTNELGADAQGAPEDAICLVDGAAAMTASATASRSEKVSLLSPHEMVFDIPRDDVAIGVFASSECSYLTTRDGCAYGCGLNGHGQVGTGTASTVVWALEPIRALRHADWLGGGQYTSAALVGSQVFTWGKAEECGHGIAPGSPPVLVPRVVASLPAIRALRCGMAHMLACSEDGAVFTWGCGITHQLGNRPRDVDDPHDAGDDPEDELEPYRVSSKALAGRFAFMADGGAQHSVVLAHDGKGGLSIERPEADEQPLTSYLQSVQSEAEEEAEVIKVETREEFWRVQIEAVYRRRNPYKLENVPDLMEKYEGQEAVLYTKICRKYDLDPSKFYADPAAWDDEASQVDDGGNELSDRRDDARVACPADGGDSTPRDGAGVPGLVDGGAWEAAVAEARAAGLPGPPSIVDLDADASDHSQHGASLACPDGAGLDAGMALRSEDSKSRRCSGRGLVKVRNRKQERRESKTGARASGLRGKASRNT